MTTLTLIRGLPGSGKSTLAKRLPGIHVEADMWHVNDNGDYVFVAERVADGHRWCLTTAVTFLRSGHDVIVSNTFTTRREINPYVEAAVNIGARVEIIHMTGVYGNVHEVPVETLQKMHSRWEEYP